MWENALQKLGIKIVATGQWSLVNHTLFKVSQKMLEKGKLSPYISYFTSF